VNCNRIETSLGTIYFTRQTKPTDTSKRDFQNHLIAFLLQSAGYEFKILAHKTSGQPELLGENTPNISISHSQEFGAIYLAQQAVGIDIQAYHAKIFEGKDYFINEYENEFTSNLDLHIIWAAKEVIFKSCEGDYSDARNEITVQNIDNEAKTVSILTHHVKKRVGYYVNEEFILAYSLD